MVKKALFGGLLAVLVSFSLWADQISATQFKGLNDNENSVIIDPTEAQDLLNVDVTPGGKSVKKRSGYGVYKALGTGKAVHGGYHAFDSTGNDYQLWGSSSSLYGIVADATPTQLISSATLNSTWDCTDTQGSSYCVNSNRDAFIKTAGATMTWYPAPLGTMVESTPDRVIVAGVSGSPNTLYVSQSNTFTNFTVGVNPTDPFTEVIASPGSKLTHIRWGCGKVLWWKDQSFGYFDFDDQFTAQVKTVSDTIGTFDNTSAIDPGGQVWFRGQDGHTWMYDCSNLSKQSIDITPNVQASGRRVSNSWVQTTQADFQTGSSVPSANISTTISPGDVIVSSFGATENSSTQWNFGTTSNMTVNVSSISLALNNSGTVTNPSFESGGNNSSSWNRGGAGRMLGWNSSATTSICTITGAQSGSWWQLISEGSIGYAFSFEAVDASSNVIQSVSLSNFGDCTWRQGTLTPTDSNKGRRVYFRIHYFGSLYGDDYLRTNDSYIWGGPITFYYATTDALGGAINAGFDNIQSGSSTITLGAFRSQVYDTSFTSSTYQLTSFTWTANTSTPTFTVETSSSNPSNNWVPTLTSSGTNAIGNRYVRYVSTIAVGATDNAFSAITAAAIVARSTGTYYSAVKNAPNLTGWGIYSVNQVLNGGTETYYIRSSTNPFTVLSSTPSWVSQSIGGLVSASTGTYFQVRDDFALTAATQTPTLNDFTVNWVEGSASDQAYMIYFDNAIWESVASGSGQSTNNYIFKYDLINQAWTLYNFGAGGMLVEANTLYFGDTSTSGANIFNYGTGTSDNGTAIQAFWRSKSYTGTDPFLQTQLTNIDVFAKKDQGTTLTSTYTTDTSTSTAYSIVLSTTNLITQNRKLLPSGKLGYVWDLKLGDTSASSAWEILGYRVGLIQQPYRPTQ